MSLHVFYRRLVTSPLVFIVFSSVLMFSNVLMSSHVFPTRLLTSSFHVDISRPRTSSYLFSSIYVVSTHLLKSFYVVSLRLIMYSHSTSSSYVFARLFSSHYVFSHVFSRRLLYYCHFILRLPRLLIPFHVLQRPHIFSRLFYSSFYDVFQRRRFTSF